MYGHFYNTLVNSGSVLGSRQSYLSLTHSPQGRLLADMADPLHIAAGVDTVFLYAPEPKGP